jgi:small subunit ribosomal protein S6
VVVRLDRAVYHHLVTSSANKNTLAKLQEKLFVTITCVIISQNYVLMRRGTSVAVKESRRKSEAADTQVAEGQPHDYEMVVVLRPAATDAENEKAVENLQKMIEGQGGSIKQMEPWGKKKLAYPIAHLSEGYYILVRFNLDPAKTREIENKLRINEQVLRHLLVVDES